MIMDTTRERERGERERLWIYLSRNATNHDPQEIAEGQHSNLDCLLKRLFHLSKHIAITKISFLTIQR